MTKEIRSAIKVLMKLGYVIIAVSFVLVFLEIGKVIKTILPLDILILTEGVGLFFISPENYLAYEERRALRGQVVYGVRNHWGMSIWAGIICIIIFIILHFNLREWILSI